jgi:hypothetical protein
MEVEHISGRARPDGHQHEREQSTVTHAGQREQAASGGPAGHLLSGPLRLVFLPEFAALTGCYLLLSGTPG